MFFALVCWAHILPHYVALLYRLSEHSWGILFSQLDKLKKLCRMFNHLNSEFGTASPFSVPWSSIVLSYSFLSFCNWVSTSTYQLLLFFPFSYALLHTAPIMNLYTRAHSIWLSWLYRYRSCQSPQSEKCIKLALKPRLSSTTCWTRQNEVQLYHRRQLGTGNCWFCSPCTDQAARCLDRTARKGKCQLNTNALLNSANAESFVSRSSMLFTSWWRIIPLITLPVIGTSVQI